MNDRVVGVFEDRPAADNAMSRLLASGVEQARVTVKRVLRPGHRGFSDSDKVHDLIHAPEIHESDTASQDAGTVILIVDMVEPPDESDAEHENDDGGLDPHDNAAVIDALERLGATSTHVVEATPGLDL